MILKPNNDVLYHLKKAATKKNITVEKLINTILAEWSNDIDNDNFKKTSKREDVKDILDGEDASMTTLKELSDLVTNSLAKYGDVMIGNEEPVIYKRMDL